MPETSMGSVIACEAQMGSPDLQQVAEILLHAPFPYHSVALFPSRGPYSCMLPRVLNFPYHDQRIAQLFIVQCRSMYLPSVGGLPSKLVAQYVIQTRTSRKGHLTFAPFPLLLKNTSVGSPDSILSTCKLS